MKMKRLPQCLPLILCLPLLVGVSACDRPATNVHEKERTVGEAIDDKTLSSNVRTALDTDAMKYPDVQVTAFRGVVQLSGFVDSREQKGRANDVAKNVAGVRKVENNISIKEQRKP